MKKRRVSKTVEQEIKETIARLCGLFLIVYSFFSLLTNSLSGYVAFPITYLFGSASLIVDLVLLVSGITLLLFKKTIFSYLKGFQILILISLFIFILASLSIEYGVKENEMTFTTCFETYKNVYFTNNPYTLFDDVNIKELDGGLVGYVLLGTVNRFTDMNYVITKIIVIGMAIILTLAFVIPLGYDFVCLTKRIANKIHNKNKKLGLTSNSNNKSKGKEDKSKKEKTNYFKEWLAEIKEEKEQRKLEKEERRQAKLAKKEASKKKETRNIYVKDNNIANKQSDGLLETTEIDVTGMNYSYNAKAPQANDKLRGILSCYEDVLYDLRMRRCELSDTNDIDDLNETVCLSEAPFSNLKYNEFETVSGETQIDEDKVYQEETMSIFPGDKVETSTIVFDKTELEDSSTISLVNEEREVTLDDKKDDYYDDDNTIELDANLAEAYAKFTLPSTSLLNDPINNSADEINEKVAEDRISFIQEKLDELGVKATVTNYILGPAITRFEVVLSPGVRVSTFVALQDDIKLALGVSSLRIQSPIPGKIGTIGLEVPNEKRSSVYLKELLEKMPTDDKEKINVPIGQDIDEGLLYYGIAKMPHCLISGSTNSGKSVCANSIITSLLMRYTPDELRLILIDPKEVEMVFYKDIPHLLCPIINEAKKAKVALEKLQLELIKRKKECAAVGEQDIHEYNKILVKEGKPRYPYIIVVIDEFAELMLDKNHREFEDLVQSVSQLGRAFGVHMIIATQRPDVNVIDGTIKNNFPCRLTFRLSSQADSRTVIDQAGAEKLLNNGDMLLQTPDSSDIRRVQGTYISKEEIKAVCNYWRSQGTVIYDPRFLDLRTTEEKVEDEKLKFAFNNKGIAKEEIDPMYEIVKKHVIESQKASTSYLERKFRIGYGKAARYIDDLEEEGIIGPDNGPKGREVLVKKDD